jgi:hypothetical protein
MMLGNLYVADIEKRLGVDFPEPFRSDFSGRHNPDANYIRPGKWHCFDIPFVLVCGDMAVVELVRDNLMPLSSEMETALHINVVAP